MSQKRGVYFLANDKVLDVTIAFLNSFRSYNSSIPLCLLPFDDNIRKLATLQSQYGFSIWQNPAVLRQCDDISLSFYHRTKGHYRKLAAWEGEFDEFIYIDSDTVVLRNIDFVFDYLKEFCFMTSKSDIPKDRKHVWKKSIDGTGKLTPEQLCFAANTGFIASKRECLELGNVVNRLPDAMELAAYMTGFDQPFLNYLIVTSGMRYTSLHKIALVSGSSDIPQECWAWDSADIVVRDGQIIWPESPPVLLVHWAGKRKPAWKKNRRIPLYELWNFYRGMSATAGRSWWPVRPDA